MDILLPVIDSLIQFSSSSTKDDIWILIEVTILKNLYKSSIFSEFLWEDEKLTS